MAEEKLRDLNKTQNQNEVKKGKKKRRRYLKKSVRRTMGALLLVTALIVAAIPVSDAQALTPDTTTRYQIPELSAILNDTTQYYHVGPAGSAMNTSVKTTTTDPKEMILAFPYDSSTEFANIFDSKGNTHLYYQIDMTNMNNAYPVPVFKLGKKNDDKYSCLIKYVGGGGTGYSPKDANSTINLGDSLIYQAGDLSSDKTSEEVPITDGMYFSRKPTSDEPEAIRYSEYCVNVDDSQIIKLYMAKVRYKYDEIITYDSETGEPVVTGYKPHSTNSSDATDGSDNHEYEVIEDLTIDPNTGKPRYFVRQTMSNMVGISYIQDEAFAETRNFATIKIPDRIHQIGNKAFYNCNSLRNLDLTDATDIAFIGSQAFAGCTSLETVSFRDVTALKAIGDGAFAGAAIGSIQLPSGVEMIGSAAFYGCESLNDTYIPSGSTSLSKEAGIFGKFSQNEYPVIGDYAFANCISMTASKLPVGNRQIGKGGTATVDGKEYKTTGYGLYAGCSNLQYVELPEKFGDNNENQTMISEEFFTGCNNLKWVRFYSNLATAYDAEFTTNTNKNLEPHKTKGKLPNVPDSFAIWGPDPDTAPNAFKYAIKNSNTYMYFDQNENKFKYILVQGGYRFEFDESGKVVDCKYNFGDDLTNVEDELVIPPQIGDLSISELGDEAFVNLNKTKPTLISIPDTVTRIGNGCFNNVGAVESIECKTTGVDIGEYAFANNGDLKEFKFAQTNGNGGGTNLGAGCFMNDPNLTYIAFRDDNPMGDAYYDVNIVNVGDKAFYTTGTELTMKGKMEIGYAPYDFAINGDSKFGPKVGSHIVYESGNPQNLVCQYQDPGIGETEGYVSLISFPDQDTVVDGGTMTVKSIWDKAPDITYNQKDILEATQEIKIPLGITHFERYQAGVKDPIPAMSAGPKEYVAFKNVPGLKKVIFDDSVILPDNMFAIEKKTDIMSDLESVEFNGDVVWLGEQPFKVVVNEDNSPHVDDGISKVSNVAFNGENPEGTPENPRYFFANGIIYADMGADVSLEECLTTRGTLIGPTAINPENDPDINSVSLMAENAFENCDHIMDVDLSGADRLKVIPDGAFDECDNLLSVELNANVDQIEDAFNDTYDYITVTIPAKEIDISDTAFHGTLSPTLKSYDGYAAQRYVRRMNKKPGNKFNFVELSKKASLLVKFMDYEGTVLKTQTVEYEKNATPPADPVRDGYTFTGWIPSYYGITDDTTCVAQYKPNGSSSSSSSSTGSSSGTTSSTAQPTPSSSSSGSTSSSSKSSSSTSSSSSATPIILSGQNATPPVVPTTPVSSGGSSGGGSGSSNNISRGGSGKTTVQSTVNGITDVGKMSATVNGSSDNYVVKITQTQEATDSALAALQGAFGNIDAIRYLPMDISLYDSTGTNKISPIPAGTSVSVTIPIPDDLAIYGGNAKVASTVDGRLEKMQPRFTVINSVPCMTFTCTHFSPYVVYVDTANLTEAGIADATPKTADPIHPKWFLCIGLTAVAILLFLKRDPEDYMKKGVQA